MPDRLLSDKSVLVVEDEMLVLMAIEDMLSDLGCTSIKAAGSIDQALAMIAQHDFDLATIDVNLNGEISYPVAEALSARGVPFAFSTGYGEHGVNEGFGDRPVLTKPYGAFQLIKVLTDLLDRSAAPVPEAA